MEHGNGHCGFILIRYDADGEVGGATRVRRATGVGGAIGVDDGGSHHTKIGTNYDCPFGTCPLKGKQDRANQTCFLTKLKLYKPKVKLKPSQRNKTQYQEAQVMRRFSQKTDTCRPVRE
ncbi:hypothetical protein YC2023_054217 [Brassica napus]